MKQHVLLSVKIFLGLIGLASLASGEVIRGTTTDPSGAVIPGATVQLLVSGKAVAETRTDGNGEFTLTTSHTRAPDQAANDDDCTITAEADGFAPSTRTIRLSSPGDRYVSLVLEIAPYRQSVEVKAKVPVFKDTLEIDGVRESSARDVGEALTALDGVWKIRKAGIANDLVIRGFQQNNINVLVDGSRTYGACPSHMDPPAQHVDFAEVDHVEVTKGAFDVQNQGSLGAVVNIATKDPSSGFSLKPAFSAGSFGYYNPSVATSFGNRIVRILGGYSYRTSEPYKDGSGRRFTDYAPYSMSGRQSQGFTINTGWMETEFSLSDRQQLTLSYSRQQAGLILYPYLMMDSDHDNADRAMFKYSVKDLAPWLRSLRAETYFTRVKHFMSDSQRISAMNGAWTMASDASTRVVGGRVEGDLGRDFTVGTESYYRRWNVLGYMKMGMMMTNPSVPDVDTKTLGAFIDYHHSISDRLRVSGGLRFDHANMQIKAPNPNTDLYYQFQNTRRTSNNDNYPSGNVHISLAFPRSVELFAGVGTTGRIPDAEERFFSRGMGARANVGNPLLPIVRNTELTTGININHGRFYLRPDVFYSYLNDYVIVNNQPQMNMLDMGMGSMGPMASPTARSYTNIGARIYGGELVYGFSFTNTLSLSGGGSYSRGTASTKMSANVISTNLPEMPPLRTWAALRYARRWAFAEFGGVAVSRQSLVNMDLQETPTAGYGLLNLKLGFTHRRFSGSFTLDNLLNHFYYEHFSYYRDPFAAGVKIPEPGRNFFLQIRCSF